MGGRHGEWWDLGSVYEKGPEVLMVSDKAWLGL